MYPGGTPARDADIEAGAGRPAGVQAEDLASTAEALAPRLEALSGPLATDRVEMRGGLEVEARTLPFLRLRELVFHHVDLDAGFTFEDVEDDLVRRFVDDAVTRLRRHPKAPRLELRSSSGGSWSVAGESGDGATVTGAPAGLLLWLARRDPAGVRAEGPLPELPQGA
jgi:maleylpyruvate isomerase